MDENGDSFEERSDRFIDWLSSAGATISPKVKLADLRLSGIGRGLLAIDDLEEDEELFRLPRSSVLTFDASDIHKRKDLLLDDEPWLSLILTMVYECQQGNASSWKAYFDVLPLRFDTLMYWTDQELGLLKGSAVVKKIGKASADKVFREQLIPVMKDQASIFNVESLDDDVLLALCHRMGSTIMAYGFDLEKTSNTAKGQDDGWEEDSDEGQKGMVPLADMLNADADRNNSRLFYEDNEVVMRTTKAVKKGEELFNDYGPLPRADLLRRYGYMTDKYAKYDVVELSLDLIKSTAIDESKMQDGDGEARIEYLDEQGAIDDGYDVFRASNESGQFSDELKVLLNALAMPSDDFEKLRSKEKLPKPALSKDASELLHKMLIRRLAMYAKVDVEMQDAAGTEVCNSDEDGKKIDQRRKMARQVIAGERLVLQEAVESVQELLGDGKKRKADTIADEASLEPRSSKRNKDLS